MTRTVPTQTTLPTLTELKSQSRRLREALERFGNRLGHSAALEAVAQQYGYRDWNTLRAAADRPMRNRPKAPVMPGDTVSGQYLGQAFTGEVVALRQLQDGAHYRVTLQFDAPVDVVKFDSFSALRHRVNATIDARGISPQHTSDGQPQLRLDLGH
ncbi:hypothetical protein CLV78_10118 [Aliiruegeria haliotis]|uniref:Glyoxalase-related protein domain-containing protein n=1 Tax=Aliiruegeria haliotis TaxID=1280846 RepID=A0A2T0RXN8_9RHOB|nr:glyoxalase superfamily protein [Aliiruegeria haliotis]PRY25928.1 hypothetical protein CLV78_10118 [Aliiruegeria haliotis]